MLEFKSEDLLLEDCSILNINQVNVQIGNTMTECLLANKIISWLYSVFVKHILSVQVLLVSVFCSFKQHFTVNIKSEFIARGSDAIKIEEQ